jgi:septal ring factor EnvC (AmiA/AmiB activator)
MLQGTIKADIASELETVEASFKDKLQKLHGIILQMNNVPDHTQTIEMLRQEIRTLASNVDDEVRKVGDGSHRLNLQHEREMLALTDSVNKMQEQLKEDMSSLITENKKFRIQPVDATMMQSLQQQILMLQNTLTSLQNTQKESQAQHAKKIGEH